MGQVTWKGALHDQCAMQAMPGQFDCWQALKAASTSDSLAPRSGIGLGVRHRSTVNLHHAISILVLDNAISILSQDRDRKQCL